MKEDYLWLMHNVMNFLHKQIIWTGGKKKTVFYLQNTDSSFKERVENIFVLLNLNYIISICDIEHVFYVLQLLCMCDTKIFQSPNFF